MTTDLSRRLQHCFRAAAIVAAAAGVAVISGVFTDFQAFAEGYHFAFLFWVNMSLGSLGIALLLHFLGGRWADAVLPATEAGVKTLPLMLLLLIPIMFYMQRIFPWTRPELVAESHVLQSKVIYLNEPFFIARSIFYFAVWIGLGWALLRAADRRRRQPDLPRPMGLCAGGLVAYFLTATFAAIDWGMSLEPRWFSTTYGFLFITGQALQAWALFLVIALALRNHKPLKPKITGRGLIDLGNFLLLFVLLWAYISFTQYLIIWSSDLQSDNFWYLHRSRGGWEWLGRGLMVFLFALPFFALLSRALKRTPNLLLTVAAVALGMRFADTYWQIMPAFYPEEFRLNWMAMVAAAAMGGVWLAFFFRFFRQRLDAVSEAENSQEGGSPHEKQIERSAS